MGKTLAGSRLALGATGLLVLLLMHARPGYCEPTPVGIAWTARQASMLQGDGGRVVLVDGRAVDSATGQTLWTLPEGWPEVGQDVVLVVSREDPHVRVFDRSTGEPLWDRPLGPSGSARCARGLVWLVTASGVEAYSPRQGNLVWRLPDREWTGHLEFRGDMMLVSREGHLGEWNLAQNRLAWSLPLQRHPSWAAIWVRVFLAPGRLLGIDGEGDVVWEHDLEADVHSWEMLLAGDLLLMSPNPAELVALEARTGRIAWRSAGTGRPLADLGGGLLLAGGTGGNLILELRSGRVRVRGLEGEQWGVLDGVAWGLDSRGNLQQVDLATGARGKEVLHLGLPADRAMPRPRVIRCGDTLLLGNGVSLVALRAGDGIPHLTDRELALSDEGADAEGPRLLLTSSTAGVAELEASLLPEARPVRTWRLPVPGGASRLQLPLRGPGRYALRLRLDGAESRLQLDVPGASSDAGRSLVGWVEGEYTWVNDSPETLYVLRSGSGVLLRFVAPLISTDRILSRSETQELLQFLDASPLSSTSVTAFRSQELDVYVDDGRRLSMSSFFYSEETGRMVCQNSALLDEAGKRRLMELLERALRK